MRTLETRDADFLAKAAASLNTPLNPALESSFFPANAKLNCTADGAKKKLC
jgi:hypothetical protein